MAVSLVHKRLFRFLFNVFIPKSKLHIKARDATLRDMKRNFSTRNYHKKTPGPILYKINFAQFYNGSKLLYNVSTYDNLVKQKSVGNAGKTCTENKNKEHPGRHKFHKEIEAALNDQVEMEFNASFAYLSMACYYGRSEVALPGCQGFFMMMHEEEHEHAVIFLNYILMRGGHVKVPCVGPPEHQDWSDISKTFTTAVQMECQVKEKLEELVELSEKHRDHQLVDFISSDFLEEQNKSIQTLCRLLTRSKMASNDNGEFLFDQHLYESFVKHHKGNLMYKTHLPQEEDKEVYK